MTRIEIASDQAESAEFAEWLNALGYDASVGRTTGSYVNGVATSAADDASTLLALLWEEYSAS